MSVYIRWLVGGGNYFYVGLELCPCQNGPLVLPQIGSEWRTPTDLAIRLKPLTIIVHRTLLGKFVPSSFEDLSPC